MRSLKKGSFESRRPRPAAPHPTPTPPTPPRPASPNPTHPSLTDLVLVHIHERRLIVTSSALHRRRVSRQIRELRAQPVHHVTLVVDAAREEERHARQLVGKKGVTVNVLLV